MQNCNFRTRAIFTSLLAGWVALGVISCAGADPGPDLGTGGATTSQGGSPPTGGATANGGVSTGGQSISTGGRSASTGGASTGGASTSSTGGTPSGNGGKSGASGGAGSGSGGASNGGMSGATAGGASGAAGAGPAGGSSGSLGCGKAGKTGQFQAQITAAALDRGYYLSVPTDYDPNKPYPLIFGYHGSNYTGQKMRTYLDLEKAPLVGKTIFVYPDGLPLPDEPDNVAWILTEGSRDLVFFDELYKKLREEYCIDPDRVFANGQSYGGLMTNAVGCLRGDVLRAIAVVAGSGPRGSSCKGQVAAWLTHGTDDTSVSFASGEKSRDFWVAANHCMSTTVTGTPAQCQNYQGCDAGYPVIWCPHTADGGHQHPSFGRQAVREFFATFY
jgi:poly(3-hydroxybutyrate) depolymerase